MERRVSSSSRRRQSEQQPSDGVVNVTGFAERSALLAEMADADAARLNAFASAKLALAELGARAADAEAAVGHAVAATPRTVGGSGSGGESDASLGERIASLRVEVSSRTLELRELRARLTQQARELTLLHGAVIRTEAAAGQSPMATDARQQVHDALAKALKAARQRFTELAVSADQTARAISASPSNGGNNDGEDNEAERIMHGQHNELRSEIDQLQRRVREMKVRVEDSGRERAAIETKIAKEKAARPPPSDNISPTAAYYATESHRIAALQGELKQQRSELAKLRKLQWAHFAASPKVGLRAVAPVERMSEAMSYLKSTVIHFGQDLRKIRTVLRHAAFDKEQVFKRAHNELKIVVGQMLPPEDELAFQRARDLLWPVTEELMMAKFPMHKLDTSYSALQDMVIAWDAMSEAERDRLTTAHDVVANAEVLYLMARFIARVWREKRTAMKQRASGV